MLKQLKYLSKKDWLLTFISCVFIVANVYCELEIPEYMEKIINTITSSKNVELKSVLINGAYMLGFAVASVVSIITSKYFSSKVAVGLGKKLRLKVYEKVIDFSNAEIKHFSTSSLITRSTNDIVQVQNLIAMGMTILVKAPVMAVMAITKIVTTNMAWTVATASAVGVIAITITLIVFIALPRFKNQEKDKRDVQCL